MTIEKHYRSLCHLMQSLMLGTHQTFVSWKKILFQVLKRGSALGRSIDLSRIAGYDELISELDSMFDFKGSLINGNSGWHVVPMDDDGDMILLGDFPWQLSENSFIFFMLLVLFLYWSFNSLY